MFGLLLQCINVFGLQGLSVYFKLKMSGRRTLNVPGIKHPIMLRGSKADKITFKEIFMRKEYAVELPASITPEFIIDGGANIGFTSIFFANRYPAARILSIEPDADNFKSLVENTKPYANITPVQSALWHRRETIHVVDRGYGERGFMIDRDAEGTTLQAASIVDLMEEYKLPHIDILKMDIEGSEKEVFEEGYSQWLPRTKCLIVELHDRMKPGCSKALFKALVQYDFSMSIRGENLVFTNNAPVL